jgi:hypothetical protein
MTLTLLVLREKCGGDFESPQPQADGEQPQANVEQPQADGERPLRAQKSTICHIYVAPWSLHRVSAQHPKASPLDL